MKFLVTECEFDLNDDYDMSKDDRLNLNELQIELEDSTVGVWEADDEDDLIEEITSASGWCIKSIDYEIQLKQYSTDTLLLPPGSPVRWLFLTLGTIVTPLKL